VFAVVITVLVLELKPPSSPSLEALVSLWPTAMSYAISYLFIAIVWINHHHLLRYADFATKSSDLGKFFSLIHSLVAAVLNRLDRANRTRGQPGLTLRWRFHLGERDVSILV
jgi:hypothetical protein